VFITFEGIEGCGKTTQIRLLRDYLGSLGLEVLVTMEPGGSRLGKKLRSMLLSVENKDITREAELFLYLADRAQHVQQVIRPALKDGRTVISDRYADSTVVYQGYGRGMDPDIINRMNLVAAAGVWPGITFLLDLPPETGLARAMKRNKEKNIAASEGRFEDEALDFHRRVRQGYLEWAARNRNRFVVLDASADEPSIFETLREKMDQALRLEQF